MILFVQPFGISAPGGGARILRALLKDAPVKWMSVATTPRPIPKAAFGDETQFGGRPYFGKLENSRFARLSHYLDAIAARRLEGKLMHLCKHFSVSGIHGVAHACWDTVAAYRAATRSNIPFFLTVHDLPAYCLKNHPLKKIFLRQMAEVWRGAAARFVISEELGAALSQEWGQKPYRVVTDGLSHHAAEPAHLDGKSLGIYFMGLFHLGYEPNLVVLQEAMALLAKQHGITVRLKMRCGSIRPEVIRSSELLTVLPFADETTVWEDMKSADLLYLPLSFKPADVAMSAYSLSTKLVSYLGSGIPIFYHGPESSAAGQLLARNNAAVICPSNDPQTVAFRLAECLRAGNSVVHNALKLATERFTLHNIFQTFWNPILEHCAAKDAAYEKRQDVDK